MTSSQVELNRELEIPKFPEKLEGSFWGMTTFFNPAGYGNKAVNYRKFRESLRRQGLKLVCVELAFNDKPFELKNDDAEILIQVRSNSIMWQKERLLNIAFKNLPPDCDKVAWIDCDIIFNNDDWIKEAAELLERFIIVQLFSFIAYLPREGKILDFYNIQFKERSGQAFFYFGMAYAFAMAGNFLFDSYLGNDFPGRAGGAWACRRDVLEKCGFFDACIFGSNDGIMAYAICGVDKFSTFDFFSKPLTLEQSTWHKEASELFKGSCFYVDGILTHLWHGELDKREYAIREEIGRKYNFDPSTDLKLNEGGCFEWASDKKEMHKSLQEYFLSRQEE